MSSTLFQPFLFVSGVRSVCAVCVLFAGAFGIGRLVFFRRSADALCVFASGVWITAVVGLTGNLWLKNSAASGCLAGVWGLFALYGAWSLRCLLKKHPGVTAGCALLLFLTLASALLPPWNWDEQVYQVSLPVQYWMRGCVAVLPDNPYSAYPSLPHFFLLPLLPYGGVTLPRLAVWALSGVLAAWLFCRLQRFGKALGAALFLSLILSPLSLGLNQAAYAEFFVVLFAAAGAAALAEEKTKYAVWIAGAAGGAALAVKLTGAAVPLMLFVYLLTQKTLRRDWLHFLLAAFAAAFPFFLRMALCCNGNPFYPYGSCFWGSPAAALVEQYHHLLGSARYGLGPLTGTVFGWFLTAASPRLYDGMGTGWQFPLLWLFSAGCCWYLVRSGQWGKQRWHAMILALAAGYLFWGFTAQQSRFLYVELCILLFVSGFAAKELLSVSAQKKCAAVLVLATLVSVSPGRLMHYRTAWKLLPAAQKEPTDFLAHAGRDDTYWELIKELSVSEIRGKVALLWERRTLYLPRNGKQYSICHPRFQEKLTPPPDSPAALYRELKAFDYVCVSLPERDVDQQPEFVEENSRLMEHFSTLVREGYFEVLPPGFLFRRKNTFSSL